MVQALTDLLANPLVWKILVGYWVFSAFVGALPAPDKLPAQTGYWVKFFYQIVFSFLHALAGNLNRAAIAFKVPGAQNGGNPPAGG